jgi:hypothetical protein
MPKKMHPLKRQYGKLDVSGWDFTAMDVIKDAIDKALNQALAAAFDQKESVYIAWASEWTDADGYGDGFTARKPEKKFVEPLDLYVVLQDMGIEKEENDVVLSFNLRESLSESIAMCKDDGSFADGLKRISTALRALCDDIDAALPK